MTSAQRIEHTVEAYLSNEDSPDISNPIHSSDVAAQFGFSGALVGGVTLWGWATSTVLEALGEGWLDHGWAEFSFRQPTYPGDQPGRIFNSADFERTTLEYRLELAAAIKTHLAPVT